MQVNRFVPFASGKMYCMKTVVCMLFTLIYFRASSQPQEYIVTHKGDTIAGSFTVLPHRITVTKPGTKDTISFASDEVWLAVKDKNVRTVLKLVLYGYTDNVETVQSPNYTDPVYDTTLLLKPLITGEKLNLYTAKDKRRVDYYFIQGIKDSVPVQLLYAVGGRMPEKSSWGLRYEFVNYVNRYKIFADQLRTIAGDCSAIPNGDYEMLVYLESSLKKFIRKYNKKCN
jgi:hypothetical protein